MTGVKLSVIGGGAWGTALAQAFVDNGSNVLIWAREPEVVDDINSHNINSVFLPGVELNPVLRATGSLGECAGRDIILIVVPAQHARTVIGELAPQLNVQSPLLLCSKGIEQATGKLMSDVIAEVAPSSPFAVLSGPSFAADVARGLPTALTLACENDALGARLAEILSSNQLRMYWTNDVLGAELGGAVKNVMAIAAGIVHGRGLGTSAHAALITRGFSELRRFGEVLGADPETLHGLSGLGDLILTCGSPKSRNMSLGMALGEGKTLQDVLGSRKAVTEGVATAAAVMRLAKQHDIEMPIVTQIQAIIDGTTTVDEAILNLMQRPLKAED